MIKEKDSIDAPSWYSAEEASAWSSGYNKALEDTKQYKDALLKIAFDFKNVSSLHGNPMKWPCTIAYLALGGKFEGGRQTAYTIEEFLKQ